MTETLPPPSPSDPQPAPERPRLRRSSTDRMAGGVCGGLADHTGIDPVLWRVGFVGLTVAGGVGFWLYLLLWVLLPPAPDRADETPSPLEQLARRLNAALTGNRWTAPR
ncbi:PspC domain-containing protein [Blastococcus xanthinilyticus]|nr:PspC domain-containing protein [Blastococcus xanthinilyticus]